MKLIQEKVTESLTVQLYRSELKHDLVKRGLWEERKNSKLFTVTLIDRSGDVSYTCEISFKEERLAKELYTLLETRDGDDVYIDKVFVP